MVTFMSLASTALPSVIQLVSVGSVSEVIVYVCMRTTFNFLCKKYNYERGRGGRKLYKLELKWKMMTDFFELLKNVGTLFLKLKT